MRYNARPLEVPELSGSHIEGGRRGSRWEEDLDPRQLPDQLPGQVPDGEDGGDNQRGGLGGVRRFRPLAPENRTEEEEKEGHGSPVLPPHIDVPCQKPG